jgi:cobalt/nickel transport system permease protein
MSGTSEPGRGARLDARWALLVGLGFVLTAAAVPLGRWRAMGLLGLGLAGALGYLGVAPSLWLRRWLAIAPLVAGLGVLVGWSHPARAELGPWGVAAAIAAKNAVMVGMVVLLALAYGTTGLLGGLRGLGLPAPLLGTLAFMERYVHVLGDERDRMMTARRARGARGGVGGWADRGRLLGALFVRALERGERIEAALEARGWDGRELPPPAAARRR